MDILQFTLLIGAAVVGIAWAIDIPTTKWERFTIRKKPLWAILHDAVTQEVSTDETRPQARTYTEAVTRMQEREKARSK